MYAFIKVMIFYNQIPFLSYKTFQKKARSLFIQRILSQIEYSLNLNKISTPLSMTYISSSCVNCLIPY